MTKKNIFLETDFFQLNIFRESLDTIAFEFKILTSHALHTWIPGIGVEYLDLQLLKDKNQKVKILIPEADLGYLYGPSGEILGVHLRIDVWFEPEGIPDIGLVGYLPI